MLTLYVDEKLSEPDQAKALRALASRGVEAFDYRRIPFVFPAHGASIPNEKMLEVLKGHAPAYEESCARQDPLSQAFFSNRNTPYSPWT